MSPPTRRPELASLLGSDAPIDLELLSAILHALLGSLRHSSSVYTSGLTRHSQTSDAVLLSCHCLGELGAIDPWRLSQALNSSLPSDSRQSFEPTLGPSSTTAVSNTRSATIFTVDISDEQVRWWAPCWASHMRCATCLTMKECRRSQALP